MKPQMREADRRDMAGVLKIYNDVVANTTAIYEVEPRTLDQQIAWFESRIQSKFPVFVCELDGEICGYATYGAFRSWTCYRPTIELGIHVTSKMRGKGLGSIMLKHLIEDATARGFHSMIAGIDADNEISLKLHEKFGFNKVARIPQVGFKFDRWLDLVLMQKII